jgi:hypothetical protein
VFGSDPGAIDKNGRTPSDYAKYDLYFWQFVSIFFLCTMFWLFQIGCDNFSCVIFGFCLRITWNIRKTYQKQNSFASYKMKWFHPSANCRCFYI